MNKTLRFRVTKLMWSIMLRLGVTRIFSDTLFTRIMYWVYMGCRLDLKNPVDFNQKEQWLKLYYRNPLYVKCADKYAVREYVSQKIGAKYLNECLGVFERVEDIDLEKLPRRFVLKATHGSGWNLICTDKNTLDWRVACRRMRKWLKSDFSHVGREWQYKEIPHRIVCEAFMEESDGAPLMDYKLFTFHGETKYIALEFDDEEGRHFINIYDSNWNFQRDKGIGTRSDATQFTKPPPCLAEMKDLAQRLASDFPMCRVDFYVLEEKKIVFGELTFTPGKGCNDFRPQEFCDELGGYIKLPER